MKIRILGTRGEVEPSLPNHSKHSGVLVDDTILLDLGEKEYLDCHPSQVFITHLHPDHAFFVVGDAAPVNVPVYAPEAYERGIRTTALTDPVQVGHYRVTPVPTHHSKLVKSVAYVLDGGGHRLLYTGDVIWINKEYHHLLADLDLVITDGSYIRRGGMVRKDRETGQLYGHNGIPDLIGLFRRFTGEIIFVHFGAWFYKDAREASRKLAALGNENDLTVRAAYDGMEMNLDG